MSCCMEFPKTWEEFKKEYSLIDKQEVYTNGDELMQTFRVEQWMNESGYFFKGMKNIKTIIFFALRYALPRHTYAFDLVSECILQNIENFTDSELTGMIEDCNMYYPDGEFSGDVCDQPAVDRFKARLEDILKERKISVE